MSEIKYILDVSTRDEQRFYAAVEISNPVGSRLILAFPRWSPGSYLIREPRRLIHDMSAWAIVSGNNLDCKIERRGPDEIIIKIPQGASSIYVSWFAFGNDLSVRTNHIDSSHFHMIPSATFPRVIAGSNHSEGPYIVELMHPSHWSATTQLKFVSSNKDGDIVKSIWTANSRDALYDGIIEANANEEILFKAGGRTFRLKLWDAGGVKIESKRIDFLIKSMSDLFSEFHALFGEPPWDDYAVILHLTEKARGGLEHTGSQSSQMRRSSLDPGDKDGWRDLISLISHEYVHAWNVKRLRPQTFDDYDLSQEMHTDLLWWFEGVTSWLGDMICLRSGVWSDEDWSTDLKRKLTRFHSMSGWDHQCLSDSSFESWYHLYRPHPHSPETTISYYLQGEIAAMCMDLEMRKRTNGEIGLDDVMVDLWKLHGLHIEGDSGSGGKEPRPIIEKDIVSSMNRLSKGRLNGVVRRLVHGLGAPDMLKWSKGMGRKLEPVESDEQVGWLGVHLADSPLRISKFIAGSPLRNQLQPGDEIIAINGRRTRKSSDLKGALRGKVEQEVKLTISRRGGIMEFDVIPAKDPLHPVIISGNGNKLWKAFSSSKREI
ncbi:MAG: PDZ domain-containing protein [Candidatus Thermoplasmatota archaeon]|nr:PDZ domain-containing protein [Candidatus Thermoplasmatota archaeon]MEC8384176.1 PDZ domain-containing protein [Candidatus Thermoplasmatota archaeon]|tara:strand:- start:396 stop:2198 length:1803 start_codon:yes stop_codon:yes gene_type:complete